MNIDRKAEIGSLAEGLKTNCDTERIGGLREVAKDNYITVIESPKVIISCTRYVEQEDGHIMFIRATPDKELRLQFFGHELGHALLRHGAPDSIAGSCEEREPQAVLFAEKLFEESSRNNS